MTNGQVVASEGAGGDEIFRTLAKKEALEVAEMLRSCCSRMPEGDFTRRVEHTIMALVTENDDLLEGYLKVAGEAADMEVEIDALKAKYERAENACARMGTKLNDQRRVLLDAVSAAARSCAC